jgi:glycosyltransferase involved in cell wall biosynthesis
MESTHRHRLSIVVPSLNQGEFIEETLFSILNQRGVDRDEFEIIVIDGGSSDATREILRRFGDSLDYCVSEPDQGQTDALRKGFGLATGDILGWLCADDLLTPGAVREVLDHFAAFPEDAFIYGDAIWIDRNGSECRLKREIPFSWFIWLHDHNYIPQPAAFWRAELYAVTGGVDPCFDLAMDGDLFARFAQRQRPRHLRRIWALIRQYPEQKNQRLRARSDYEDGLIRERLGATPRNDALGLAQFLLAKAIRVGWKFLLAGYVPAAMARRIRHRLERQSVS